MEDSKHLVYGDICGNIEDYSGHVRPDCAEIGVNY